ncbi:hypothetical protein VPHD148_0137 [Vibrio phage D148]
MSQVTLHLMDDRKVLKSVSTGEIGRQAAFEQLMDHVLEVLDEYECGSFDVHKDMHNIVRADVRKALRRPVTKRDITSFSTPGDGLDNIFSICWQEKPNAD